MAYPNVAPYGSWKSPITADVVAAGEVGLEQVRLDGDDVYWIERRSQEGGRKVIVRRSPDGQVADITPVGFNARTRVHEYGGGDYAVSNGTIIFSNFADQRLYVQQPGSEPKPLTPAADMRYADGVIDRRRNLFFCVREDHTGHGEAINTLVSIDVKAENPGKILVSGNDFYSSPRLSPDGSRLAWLTWNHPNMPWDGTELWVGKLTGDGSIAKRYESPAVSMSPFSSRSGRRTAASTLFLTAAVGGIFIGGKMKKSKPFVQWMPSSASLSGFSPPPFMDSHPKDGSSAATPKRRDSLATLDTLTRALDDIELPFTVISQVHAAGDGVVFIGASSTEPTSIASLNLATESWRCYADREKQLSMPDTSPIPEPLSFQPTAVLLLTDFYPPQNRDYAAPANEKPPLLVLSHGGPTSSSIRILKYSIQYWTSRGIAVLDVNYGGSTGYGREYRERLKGQWGIVDVDDCVNGARYLVASVEKLTATGLPSEAAAPGGYTTLCALTFRDIFKAGASHYGISDLEALARTPTNSSRAISTA